MALFGGVSGQIDWDDCFQQAAFDPALWDSVLRDMAHATRSPRGQLIGIGGPNAIPFNRVTDFSAQALADFASMGGGAPAINFRIAADLDPATGAIAHEADYRRARRGLVSDTYLDFCQHHEIPFGCHTMLLAEEGAMIGLAVLRGEHDGQTCEADRAEFARAARAARVAVRFQRAIEHQGVQLLAGTLDTMAIDCFLIDGFGRVGAMTAGAERIATDGRLTVVGGRLGSPTPDVARAIDLGLRSVLGGERHARVAIGGGQRMDLFRLASRDWAISFVPSVIAVIRDTAAGFTAEAAFVAASYGLSPAETEVAIMLAQGHDRAAIASARGVSAETLKAQIRALYQKTGCNREAELVALLAGFSG